MNRGTRFSRPAWQSALLALIPWLLAMVLPLQLQSQSPPDLYRGSSGSSTGTEAQDKQDIYLAEARSSFNSVLTPAGADPSTPLPTPILPLAPSAVPVTFRAGTSRSDGWFFVSSGAARAVPQPATSVSESDKPNADSKASSAPAVRNSQPIQSDRDFFYKNKLEFSLEGGWLPINIPFVFDVFLGDGYTTTSLKYTLAPIIASVRWQIGNVDGPWVFRGNWDLEASGAAIVIPRGPETRYFAFILGFRRNFVPRRGRVAPYFDGRLGMGEINAKGPVGVLYAQGQNFTFTVNMGSGLRYNFSPRYAIWTGLNWMHISNLYLSQPQFANYGINVYGPMFGIDARLGSFHHHAAN